MSLLVIPLALLCIASSFSVEVKQVVDGDTFDVQWWEYVDPPYDIDLIHNSRIRLMEVNTPEKRGAEKPLGLQVKEAVKLKIEECNITTAEYMGKGKYGRDLAYLYCADGEDLGEWISKQGWNKYICNRWDGMDWSGRYDGLMDCAAEGS